VIVLDASALLALVNHEPGWDVVARQAAGSDATISSVNYAEAFTNFHIEPVLTRRWSTTTECR
jgi:PIN domain nuclease of toxin-antitoxin system